MASTFHGVPAHPAVREVADAPSGAKGVRGADVEDSLEHWRRAWETLDDPPLRSVGRVPSGGAAAAASPGTRLGMISSVSCPVLQGWELQDTNLERCALCVRWFPWAS